MRVCVCARACVFVRERERVHMSVCVYAGYVYACEFVLAARRLEAATDGGLLFPREGNLCECERVSITRSYVMAAASDVPAIWPGIRAGT